MQLGKRGTLLSTGLWFCSSLHSHSWLRARCPNQTKRWLQEGRGRTGRQAEVCLLPPVGSLGRQPSDARSGGSCQHRGTSLRNVLQNPTEQNQGHGGTKPSVSKAGEDVGMSWCHTELPGALLFPAGPVRGLLLLHLQPAAAALVQPGQLEVPVGTAWHQRGNYL